MVCYSPSAPRNGVRTKGIDSQSFSGQYCKMHSLGLCALTFKAVTFSLSIAGTGKVILSLGAVIMSYCSLNSRPVYKQLIIPVLSCAGVGFLL